MKIQNWKINEEKSKKNDTHKTIYFVSKSHSNEINSGQLTISSSYQGEWKDDLRHGFGDLIYKNGNLYSGQWILNL